jgi:hypothetical protein
MRLMCVAVCLFSSWSCALPCSLCARITSG